MIEKFKRLTESPYTIKLDDTDRMNPDNVNFMDKVHKAQTADRAQREADRKARELANLKDKYLGGIEEIREMYYADACGIESALDALHDLLVPEEGMADTLAGEIVRAIVRIVYRYYNDGDVFFEGDGLETCGGSASYLLDVFNKANEDIFQLIMESIGDYDETYEGDLDEIAGAIVAYIVDDPEAYLVPNTTDSRTHKVNDEILECAPTYDIEVDLPDEYQVYVDAFLDGYGAERWAIEWFDSFLDIADNAEMSVSHNNGNWYISITNLNREQYEKIEQSIGYEIEEAIMKDLEAEFGEIPDEDDDTDDIENEPDDIDDGFEGEAPTRRTQRDRHNRTAYANGDKPYGRYNEKKDNAMYNVVGKPDGTNRKEVFGNFYDYKTAKEAFEANKKQLREHPEEYFNGGVYCLRLEKDDGDRITIIDEECFDNVTGEGYSLQEQSFVIKQRAFDDGYYVVCEVDKDGACSVTAGYTRDGVMNHADVHKTYPGETQAISAFNRVCRKHQDGTKVEGLFDKSAKKEADILKIAEKASQTVLKAAKSGKLTSDKMDGAGYISFGIELTPDMGDVNSIKSQIDVIASQCERKLRTAFKGVKGADTSLLHVKAEVGDFVKHGKTYKGLGVDVNGLFHCIGGKSK